MRGVKDRRFPVFVSDVLLGPRSLNINGWMLIRMVAYDSDCVW